MKALKIILTLSLIMTGTTVLANAGQDDCSQMNSGNQLNLNQPTNPSTTQLVKNLVHGPSAAQMPKTPGNGSTTTN